MLTLLKLITQRLSSGTPNCHSAVNSYAEFMCISMIYILYIKLDIISKQFDLNAILSK